VPEHPRRDTSGDGALLYSVLGSLMLTAAVLAPTRPRFFAKAFSYDGGVLLGATALFGLVLIGLGGYAGHFTRSTRNGVAALVLSCATLSALGLLLLLPRIVRVL
jgi:hypothetical protein